MELDFLGFLFFCFTFPFHPQKSVEMAFVERMICPQKLI